MKLHEVETVQTEPLVKRQAVANGWNYLYYDYRHVPIEGWRAALVSVVPTPDPTAEHVTHGAGGAAADAIYREAVGHCWKVVNEWAKRFGAPLLERAELHDALKELRFNGSTSQTGEGVDIQTEDAVRAARVAALGEAADLVKAVVVRWREVGQPLNQNDRAGFILESRILALAEPSP